MKHVLLLLSTLFLLLLAACQAATPLTTVTETAQPPAATETMPVVEPATATPTTAAPTATETVAPPPATEEPPTATAEPQATGVFDYLVDAYFEGSSWQLRGARRTAAGSWETTLVPLDQAVSIGGVDYDPTGNRAIIWDYSGNQGAGPSNLSAGPLYLVDLATDSVETLFPDSVVSARLMPGGQGYAYLLATAETYELRLVDPAGNDRVVARDVPREFTFAPDGSAIAFTRESAYGLPGAPGLYVVDLTTGAEQMLSDVDRNGTGGSGAAWAPLWSPDGDSILLRAFADGSDRLIWAARDGSWSHALLLEDLNSAAGIALEQENVCTNQEFLPIGPTTLLTAAGPCAEEPLMGAMPEATHLILLELDTAGGTLTPTAAVPAPAATFFLLAYRQQSHSVILHSPADPANTAIYEVALP